MVPPLFDVGLIAAYLLILVGVAVQYRRGKLPPNRVRLLVAMSFTWLAYGLLQLTQDGPLPAGTLLEDALDGLAVVVLVVGLYLLYRWWRLREGEDDAEATAG
jgi:hypothetical protein